MKLGYLARVLGGVSLGKLNACVDCVKRNCGRSRAWIILDMAGCALRYGAGYYDYMTYEYYAMTNAQRATYLTRMKNKKLVTMLNDEAYAHIFDLKTEFDRRFAGYLGRDFLDLTAATPEETERFLTGRDAVIAKPAEGECGHGIEKLRLDRFASPREAAAYLRDPAKGFGVVEEVIAQHPALNRLYPDSVNCLRMVTLVHEGVPYVLYAVLKTGNNGNFVDNLESGGFACHFDLEKGEICGPGHTSSVGSAAQLAEIHPATGVAFRGFRVPFVPEAVELVKRAALEVPQVRYVGWDVCITPTGPAIIEGNNYAAYDFPQLPDPGRERVGLLKQIREIGIRL